MPSQTKPDSLSDLRWEIVQNVSGEEIPPSAIMQVVGVDNDEGVVMVDKPDTDSLDPTWLYVNEEWPIPADSWGNGTQDAPVIVAYEEGYGSGSGNSGPPHNGEIWGSQAGSWFIHEGRRGYAIFGDGVDGLVYARPRFGMGDRPGTGYGSGSGSGPCGNRPGGIPISELIRCADDGSGPHIRDGCLTWNPDQGMVLFGPDGKERWPVPPAGGGGGAPPPWTPHDLAAPPIAWMSTGEAYTDLAGTTRALAESDPVKLVIMPGDSPTSPAMRYASEATNYPALHIDGSGRKWIEDGASKRLVLSTGMGTGTTDIMVLAVVKRALNTTIVIPIGGRVSNGSGMVVYSNGVSYNLTDNQFPNVAYTGNLGDVLMVWSRESGTAYFQSSGMAKTSQGTFITDTSQWDDFLTRGGSSQFTDAGNYVGEIVFLDTLPSPTEFAQMTGVGGYFDTNWGVHL